MTSNTTQDIFEIKQLLQNINIKLCARIESGVKQLLALVTSDGDIVLHYNYGELPAVVKRIPWFTDKYKSIQAICFDPSATWLLVVAIDSSLYIVPALNLVDKKQKIDCKWALTDVTHFAKHSQTPNVKPTSVVWWQTYDSNQNALVGFENGCIVVISLTDGRCLGSCNISEAVDQLQLCQDNSLDTVSLLINGKSGQQWRLILEYHSKGYTWPPDSINQSDDTTRSRLYNLKQMGVEKFASLKQKLSDARGNRRDSQTSDTASESSHSESNYSEPELLPHLCDTIFAPQFAKNKYLFSAYYKPASLLTVHAANVESAPLYVHKLPPNTAFLLLTDRLIYTINNENNLISVISSQLCECRLEGDSEFNEESMIAQFVIENETILHVYKQIDTSVIGQRKSRNESKREKNFEMPKTIEDLSVRKPRIDTCVIVTNTSVYKININCSPINKFVYYVTEENDLEKAEKLSYIFGLNLQVLLECCGDLMIARGSYHSGIILYKQAKVHLLKRVLKLAVTADCRTLLKFVHLCLTASKVDMSMATKIHIGNLAVMAYTELILRFGGQLRISNTKDFMKFLCYEEYYDQILAVNVACQAGHWNIVTLLAKSRGLQPEVVTALGQILQSARAPRATDKEFLYALSEPSLTQSLLILPQSSQIIFQYIRTNVDAFPVDILQRLVVQLDPSQACAIPLVSRLSRTNKEVSSIDSTIESIDLDNPDKAVITVKDMIETFLFVLIYLIRKSNNVIFDPRILEPIELPGTQETDEPLLPKNKLPDLRPLSCGYEHTAIIRNKSVYTMGVSSGGCLGLGPLLTHSSPPRIVQTLEELRVKAVSITCGRRHTLVLTNFGVYVWGSNAYGQLGLGHFVHESPYPQIISRLFEDQIVDIAAGQYHSMALTARGKVYTWGWGIHGQLGHGACNNEYYPRLLSFPHQIKQIAAGHAHSLILTTKGKLYGFGSNAFGQLESCQIESNKSTRPVWVLQMPDIYTKIEKVATAYFHNIAVREDQEVYTWGASPQEMRIFQSKNNQKQNGLNMKPPDSWKASVHVYSSESKRPIEQVAAGYRHSAILHQGVLLWGKNKDDELSPPKLRDEDNFNGLFKQKFSYVSCGLDYTMAIHSSGKLLAWGSPTMAQTIMGKFDEDNRSSMEGKVVVSKNTKRIIKFPNSNQGTSDNFPVEVPGLPSMAITFNIIEKNLLLTKRFNPISLLKIENTDIGEDSESPPSSPCVADSFFKHVQESPSLKFTNKTLLFILRSYYGLYDSENILQACLEVHNYQAASEVAILDGHFVDSLSFQLVAFRKHIECLDIDLASMFLNKDLLDVQEKNQNGELDLNERNLLHSNSCGSPARILSSSSSLDSIRQWGDEVEHQGGRESPCEVSGDLGDVRQNITQYVQSLTSVENSPPISSVSKIVSEFGNGKCKNAVDFPSEIKDKTARDIIEVASKLVEFYTNKIYLSENHILMQNVLMKCIEFWLSNSLPVPVLESVLLKHMDKYFYPLSILLFCKNFGGNSEMVKDDLLKTNSSGFLKEFSTKFCLQLCSMVLENVNKS